MVMRFFSVLVVVCCLASCSFSSRHYPASDVQVFGEGFGVRVIELVFSTPQESAYYCPGVTVERLKGRLNVHFVRCALGSAAKVDVAVEKHSAGKSIVRIPLRSADDLPVQVYLGGTRPMGEWSLPD